MNGRWLALLAALCLHATACAPRFALPSAVPGDVEEERRRQYAEGVEHMFAYWSRAADVTSRVRIAGAELCGKKVRAALGVLAISHDDLPWLFGWRGFWQEFRVVFEQSLAIDDRVRVIEVTPRAPGDVAGLRAGDVIASFGGQRVRSEEQLASLQAEELDAVFEIRVERAGQESALRVARVPECWYDVGLTSGPFPNAFADGRTIYVTTGLVRDAESDDELALAIGHELAHNILEHMVSYGRSEQEADYVGCYLAARAGYDVSKAPGYWRKLAREYPGLVSEDASFAHSGTATRAAALARTVEEIQKKQRAGEPLVPDLAP